MRNERGFTLIELLIVVAIIGIIAAVAIPNLLNALNTARQKRSMSDLRTIVIAISTYHIDHGYYPIVTTENHMDLVPFIGPVPARDGWYNRFSYVCEGDGSTYTAVCYGSNRSADLPYTYGPIHRHKDDIVFVDDNLLQWPEGTQSDS